MVHFAHTVAAAAAVVGTFGAHEIALVAQLPVLPLCQKKKEDNNRQYTQLRRRHLCGFVAHALPVSTPD